MLLSPLLTQLAAAAEANAADKQAEPIKDRPALSVRDDGAIALWRGRKSVLVGRPGHVSYVIIRRLLSGHPVSGLVLMNEYRLPMSTATSAIDRLVKLGLITLERGSAGRMRYEQAYQISEGFAKALTPLDDNLPLF